MTKAERIAAIEAKIVDAMQLRPFAESPVVMQWFATHQAAIVDNIAQNPAAIQFGYQLQAIRELKSYITNLGSAEERLRADLAKLRSD